MHVAVFCLADASLELASTAVLIIIIGYTRIELLGRDEFVAVVRGARSDLVVVSRKLPIFPTQSKTCCIKKGFYYTTSQYSFFL